MPYINETLRVEFSTLTEMISKCSITSAGELNYLITKLCCQYLDTYDVGYSSMNNAIGALECAKMELYRRIAVPYEDKKLIENGDVYYA
jgi:hypothetical protein